MLGSCDGDPQMRGLEHHQELMDARGDQTTHARSRAVSVMNTPRMRNCAGDCTIAHARP